MPPRYPSAPSEHRPPPGGHAGPEPAATAVGREALMGSVAATLVAGLIMALLRWALQVRSVPERLMEWLLLFVPPVAFESALQRFGFDAKRYALYAAIAVLLGLLAWLGQVALVRRWPTWALAGLGLGLWLVVMLVVMPLTSAGLFALHLLDGKRAAIGGYLTLSLAYAAVLGVAREWMLARAAERGAIRRGAVPESGERALLSSDFWRAPSRRAALALAGAAVVSFVGTELALRLLPKRQSIPSVIVADPQEPVPSGGLDQPNPHPNAVQPAAPAPSATAAPTSAAGVAEPPPSRALNRDKDGAVVTAGRPAGELGPPITSNADFYIVTKNAGGDPDLRPEEWRLVVDGEVGQPFQVDYPTLRRLPSVELTKTLECISNFVGKPELAPFGAELISTAVWTGVRLRDLMALGGGVRPGATWLAVLAADEFTSALPVDVVDDPNAVLVYRMNGAVLPREHGYPARMLVPNRYGMKSAKWVVGLRVMRREVVDWYGQRNWSHTATVQTMTRIDRPAPGARLRPGSQTVAGIAYAGTRGIARVEVSADGGQTWRDARLLDEVPPRADRWARWEAPVVLEVGQTATVVARATDGTGALQAEAFRLPEPDGGTGWPRLDLRAG